MYHEAPLLRGLYFTSGTQEGRPVDLLTSAMVDAFGIAPSVQRTDTVGEAKSYFLRDLFAKVMFPDQDVGARSRRGRREILLTRAGVGAGAFLTAVVLTILPFQAYRQNAGVVKSSEERRSQGA